MGDTAEAMVVGVMSITAMGMATAGLHPQCTLRTGRVGTIIPHTGRGTTLPTGTAGTTLPTGTLETTTKAGVVAGATPRPLMAVVGQGGTDLFRRIGCQKGAMAEAAEQVAVAMTGNRRLSLLHLLRWTDAERQDGWMARLL